MIYLIPIIIVWIISGIIGLLFIMARKGKTEVEWKAVLMCVSRGIYLWFLIYRAEKNEANHN